MDGFPAFGLGLGGMAGEELRVSQTSGEERFEVKIHVASGRKESGRHGPASWFGVVFVGSLANERAAINVDPRG